MTPAERIAEIRKGYTDPGYLVHQDVIFLLAELDRAQVALRNIEARASARNVNSPWDEVYRIARAALGGEL